MCPALALLALTYSSALLPGPAPLTADEQLVDLWLTTVGVLARSLCKDEAQPLRDNAIMVLR